MLYALRSVMSSVVAMSRQAHPGVVGDAHEGPGVVGEEAPLRHQRAF